jgi:zinc D-Ala-D-Ala carboxypeptidase
MADVLSNSLITPHFSYKELTRSGTAIRMGVDNNPPPEHLANLKLVCEHVLEPVRAAHGPVTVDSGYRAMALNMIINPMTTTLTKVSKHCTGEAVDFEVRGLDNVFLANWVVANIPDFDQVILEFYTPGDPNSGWVHVSWVKPSTTQVGWKPRLEVFTSVRVKGQVIYTKGINS